MRTPMLQIKRTTYAAARLLRKLLLFVVIALLLSWPLPSRVRAASGELDLTFGSGGKTTTDFGLGDLGWAVAIQTDGKIVVAGGEGQYFSAVRYNTNGTLDASFGSGGKVSLGLVGSGRAIAIQTDGKIVIVGNTFVIGVSDFAVVRLNTNGSLDASFGTGGVATTDFFGGFDFPKGMAIQIDGKIVVAGSAQTAGDDTEFALARYNSNGTLDSTFDGDGKLTTPISGPNEGATAVAIQSDGRIVANGTSGLGFTLIRYNVDGSLDGTFGVGGIAGSLAGVGYAMAIQPDGRIVLAGFAGYTFDFAVARFDATGHLDPSFGSGGITTTTMGGVSIAFAVAIQGDGRILAGGFATSLSTGRDFAIARYDSNGTLDSTFGSAGKVLTDFSGGEDSASGMSIQGDGRIVAAGFAVNSGTGYDFAVARYESVAFDICEQDDSNGNLLQFNSTTGAYQFTKCGSGLVLSGTGSLAKRGSIMTLQHYGTDRRVLARVDGSVNKGTASIQVFSQGTTFTIMDRNTTNNTCGCP